MSFRDIVGILTVRWYAVLAVLVITAGLSWPVTHPQPEYQATTALLLVPPKEPSAPNSLAAATPSVAATGLAVDDILQSQAEIDTLRQTGLTDPFTVAPHNSGTDETPAYTIPSEQLTVTSTDPDVALRELSLLTAAFDTNLQAMQAKVGVPVKIQITAGQLAVPAVAELHGAKSRGLAGLGLLGLGFAVAVPLWLDRWLKQRAGRGTAGGAAGGSAAKSSAAGLQGV